MSKVAHCRNCGESLEAAETRKPNSVGEVFARCTSCGTLQVVGRVSK